jgi:cupin fold WbuC family metalloprotein
MIKVKSQSPEVFVTDQPIVAITNEELAFLADKVQYSARNRTRLCAHQDPEESLHEMFVVYTGDTYMRPNRHPGKDESLHILKGSADFVFFDDEGNVTQVVELGDKASGKAFYCRVPANVWHTMIMKSDRLVIHECIRGPFRKDGTTVFAPWGPREEETQAAAEFLERLKREVSKFAGTSSGLLKMSQQSPEVFNCDELICRIGMPEIEFLRKALPLAPRKRVRVCAHKSVEDTLHEMFILFKKGTYLRTSKHLGKDESVDVIEGQADVVLFDEAGNITDVIPVSDGSNGGPFYFRTPRERYHGWIVRSDIFIVHETTEGPFRLEDTIFAPWSPDPADTAAVATNQADLLRAGDAFRAAMAGSQK